ncbi:hypothetical protein DCAR_0102032 [Daucus carota subsp. sativus]|uniref:GPI mannosyltransferase 2 n=1 Tax=Daucus carota subsp. sativus TaxID=79200 RepID=A0A166GTQ0_DAUCS|nr:PREDICTED: GPI mannosyltransferase 2 [Daucus carota subsp. sativus]WOG82863.1 hypothetical protein DCAR_0102032 [Daucus carota subsp. sativus]
MNNHASTHHNRLVINTAIASRILLLTLIIFWRSLVSPYDTSASINPNCLSSPKTQSIPIKFPYVASLIENSIVWDSVYFVRIAQCGYEYEQTYAFWPLLPFCIFVFSKTVFAPLVPLVGYRAVLGLSGYVLNNIAFVFAAVYFHRLSVIVLKDKRTALRASILFCFNPASIFFSSIYSESLYALLSIGGICHLMSGAKNKSTLWFALSVLARSNGVLNAGYIGFQTMHQAYDAAYYKRRVYMAVQILLAGALRCLCICLPLFIFQAYGYVNICHGRSTDELRPWCKARVPMVYNFIQSYYWGVGFLKYFKPNQLPNFLLAFPILSLAASSIIYYAKLRYVVFITLGFRGHKSTPLDKTSSPLLLYMEADTIPKETNLTGGNTSKIAQEDQTLRRRRQTIRDEDLVKLPSEACSLDREEYLTLTLLPFVLHLGFLAGVAFLVMHVQVATRFLSANPPLYWFASSLPALSEYGKRWGYLIWAYCVAYILLGSLLFSNFYPFT